MATTSSGPLPHPRDCAQRVRGRRLAAAGDPTEPGPVLVADIAREIIACCGHTGLKAYRLAHGWTVDAAVSAVHDLCRSRRFASPGLTARSWKEWEAGGRVSPGYQDLLCRLFQTGPVQLGLASDYSPGPARPARPEAAGIVLGAAGDNWGAMLRRTMVLGGAAAGLYGLLDAAAQPASPGRVDQRTVTDLAATAAGYRRAYRAVPASRLLPAAYAHMELVLSLRPAAQPEPIRTTLVTTAGEMACLVGVLLALDSDRYPAASDFLDLAWKAARSVDDIELQAVVLGCRSFATAYGSGDHRAGLDLADLAGELAGGGACAETQAWVAAVASERSASLGDYTGCRRRLDAAAAALAHPNERVWRGIGGFTAEKLLAYQGGDMVRLGRYAEAEPVLDAAIARLDGPQERHRCTALVDRAEARLGASELEGACLDAEHALRLVTAVQHTGNLKRIERLARQVQAAGAGRALLQQVQLVRADHGLASGQAA